MKATILVILAFGILAAGYLIETPSSVTTPEVQKTGDYSRPVKDGNCYIQTDRAGNKIRACG